MRDPAFGQPKQQPTTNQNKQPHANAWVSFRKPQVESNEASSHQVLGDATGGEGSERTTVSEWHQEAEGRDRSVSNEQAVEQASWSQGLVYVLYQSQQKCHQIYA